MSALTFSAPLACSSKSVSTLRGSRVLSRSTPKISGSQYQQRFTRFEGVTSRRGSPLLAKKSTDSAGDASDDQVFSFEATADSEVKIEDAIVEEVKVEDTEEANVEEEPVAEAAPVDEPAVADESKQQEEETEVDEETQFLIEDLKAALLDSFYGTERGSKASSEARAEVNELITQLEAVNPCSSPTDEVELLSGEWKLLYTNNSELSLILAADQLPLLTIGDIYQDIDVDSYTVENKLEIITPLSRGFVSSTANFEVRSAKRLQIKFVEGKIGTPKLLEDIPLPDKLELGGQSLDLSPLKGVAYQVQEALRPVTAVIESQPDLQIPISNDSAQSWLLTTFLDEEVRIARGDAGSLFVLTKV
ncbi:hypothetical protein CYMTET_47686 [Cymbomonas tetramitiformis]|uniref:Plastid lipid-associated protein/fibrillin conserved domain-containing protein n=1 Tax=Cymbomonas tetramitiformis TaxID=36881 RepID=A0AAE0BVN7_9CHLO|nr:hypothetical protein CYMTET_47686 [Cymbomonas tetramitiformis]